MAKVNIAYAHPMYILKKVAWNAADPTLNLKYQVSFLENEFKKSMASVLWVMTELLIQTVNQKI